MSQHLPSHQHMTSICPECGNAVKDRDLHEHISTCTFRTSGVEPDLAEILPEPTICTSCGVLFSDRDHQVGHVCDGIADRGDVSVASDTLFNDTAEATEQELDDLVAAGSVPNLATLFKRGKEAGLIKPGKEYGSSV